MTDTKTLLATLLLCASCLTAACAKDDGGEEGAAGVSATDQDTGGLAAGDPDTSSVSAGNPGTGSTALVGMDRPGVGTPANADSIDMALAVPGVPDDPDNVPTDPECNMNGSWVMASSTINTALGAMQIATGWGYLEITHDGDRFTVQRGYECGLVVRGSADVSMADSTTEALAQRTRWGRQGSFKLNAAGDACEFRLDRSYIIRGADADRFLWDLWQPGDPARPLSEFTLPSDEAGGMEDWDQDGFEGITHLTGLGNRYVAQLDWNEVSGSVPTNSGEFGGVGVLLVDYDSLEVVSSQTPFLLQVTSIVSPPGWANWVRVNPEFVLVENGEHPELETCKNAMALAVEKFGDPPRP